MHQSKSNPTFLKRKQGIKILYSRPIKIISLSIKLTEQTKPRTGIEPDPTKDIRIYARPRYLNTKKNQDRIAKEQNLTGFGSKNEVSMTMAGT